MINDRNIDEGATWCTLLYTNIFDNILIKTYKLHNINLLTDKIYHITDILIKNNERIEISIKINKKEATIKYIIWNKNCELWS